MYPNSLPYALALLTTAALTGGLALYAYGRRAEGAATAAFARLLLAFTWFSGFSALEMLAPTLNGKVVAVTLGLIGLSAVGPLWLALALHYTRRAHWLAGPNLLIIALPSLFGLALALTNGLHGLFWGGFQLDPQSPGLIVADYNIGFVAFMAALYMFIVIAGVVYAQAYAQAAQVYRLQIGLMVAGALVPVAASFIDILNLYPLPGLDLTPFAFAVSAVFLATGLFRLGLLDVQPVAARVIFNHLADACVVLDHEDRVIDLNPAARRLFNLGDEAIGLPAPAVLRQPPPPLPGALGPELQLGSDEPRHWYRLEFSDLRDSRSRTLGRVAVLRDVTHERLLHQLQSDLTHMLIHDLSNPLSATQMALEMMQFTETSPGQVVLTGPEVREAVEIVRRSNERAQRLVASLLDISRLESGSMPLDPQAVNAVALARDVLDDMQPQAEERGLTLTLDVNGDADSTVRADPDLLDRLLRNLIGNALKFTPAGGQVTLAVTPNTTGVAFTVRDTGPGLPASVQDRLFQKFVRGPGPQRGHGLGLAFCKLAVETMGGRIWAESQPGEGAAFHFTLSRG